MGVDIRISYLFRFSSFSLNVANRRFVKRQVLKLRPFESFLTSLSIYLLVKLLFKVILVERVLG